MTVGMTAGDDHVAEVMFQLSGVPEDVARRALCHAAGQAAESGVLAPEFFVPTQKHVRGYPLDQYVPDGYDVLWVDFVKYCGTCLDPIDKCDPCPHGYALDDSCHISLYPPPHRDAGKDLEVCLSVRPGTDACEFPTDLLSRCRDEIVHAMKGYLMQMPDKAWSNPQLAAFHLQRAQAGFASLGVAVSKSFSRDQTVTQGECWLV